LCDYRNLVFCPLRFTYVVTNFHQSHCLGACPSDSSPGPGPGPCSKVLVNNTDMRSVPDLNIVIPFSPLFSAI